MPGVAERVQVAPAVPIWRRVINGVTGRVGSNPTAPALAVLLAAGALAACVVTPPGVSPPPDTVAAADEAAPPAEGMSEKGKAWLDWLVDGNGIYPTIRVSQLVMIAIAEDCLGRHPTPFTPSPHPLKPDEPTEPEPEAEDKPDEISARLVI